MSELTMFNSIKIVPIIGYENTGKTHYISELLRQVMENEVLAPYGYSVNWTEPESEHNYEEVRHYYKNRTSFLATIVSNQIIKPKYFCDFSKRGLI